MNSTVIDAAPWGVGEQNQVIKNSDPVVWFGYSDKRRELTPLNAIKHGTLWRAVNVIGGDLSQTPLEVRRRTADGSEPVTSHPANSVLSVRTAPWLTPAAYKRWLAATAIIWGNALTRIVYDNRNRVLRLEPLLPEFVQYYVTPDGLPFYRYTTKHGEQFFDMHEVIHIPAMAHNGFWGYSLVEVAASELDLGSDVVQHASNTFRNGAMPSGVLELEGDIDKKSREALREDFNRIHQGAHNAGKTAILPQNVKYNGLSVTPEQAQLLEMIVKDAVLVHRLTGVPPYLLGDYSTSSTRANLEESRRDYWQQCLGPWVQLITEEFTHKLLNRADLYIRANGEHVLRGDEKTQYETANIAVAGGWMTVNEARRKNNMNDIEGGDVLLSPHSSGGVLDNEPETDSASIDTEELRERATLLLQERCEHLAEVEKGRVLAKAKAKGNFCESVDRFYQADMPDLAVKMLATATDMAATCVPVRPVTKALGEYAATSCELALSFADRAIDQRELAALIESEWNATERGAAILNTLLASKI